MAKIAAAHSALVLRPEVEHYMRERIAGEVAEKARLGAEEWERSVLAEQALAADQAASSFPARLVRRGPSAAWHRTRAEIDRRRVPPEA